MLQTRKNKYLAAQAALAEKQAPPKKEDKKDVKKPGKQPEAPPVEEPPKPPEKEYTKNFDLLFLALGYPEHSSQLVDLLILIKEKVVNWGAVDMGLLDQPDDF